MFTEAALVITSVGKCFRVPFPNNSFIHLFQIISLPKYTSHVVGKYIKVCHFDSLVWCVDLLSIYKINEIHSLLVCNLKQKGELAYGCHSDVCIVTKQLIILIRKCY